MKKYILLLFLMCLALTVSGAICKKSGQMPAEVTLKYWSVDLDADTVNAIIKTFEAQYPYVDIQFTKLNADEYEQALISGWAKDQGPDIFSFPNTYTKKYYDYIYPLPARITTSTVSEKSTLGKKETVVQSVTQNTLSPQEMGNQFADTVYTDAVFPHQAAKEKIKTEKIFGIPLAMDTLALYWNKDLLNQKTIALPAQNWQAIADHAKEITALDKEGNIIRSGIAMGTTDNTPHYFDIMSVLMMQFGATMANEEGYVTFDKSSAEDKNRVPAMEALDFYVKFAQDKWETYNWNETKNNALEEFAAGNIAYYLGYHQEMAQIKQLAPTLNFDVAPLPQINTVSQINYPSYWLESVSANSKNQHLAWAFVQYLTNETNAGKYLTTTKQPASRRALINEQLADYELATFAEQALTAKSWYHGTNPQEAINLFKLMIDNARLETFTLEEIIRDTAAKVQLTVNP